MIRIEGLSKSFNENNVLQDISFEIEKGDVIAIIGPSGTGKSTLLRCLNQLEIPEKGKIYFDNQEYNLTGLKKKKEKIELIKKTAMVFQHYNLFSRKTALQNVMEALVHVKKIDKKEAEVIARRELAKVGMSNRENFYPKHLSGGQQQRVAIARAIAINPELLLLDEPTSALDPELVGEVLNSIKTIAKEGNTMLIVSHEINFVRQVSNKVIFMEKGKIVEAGPTEQIFENPKNERTKEFLIKNMVVINPEYVI